MILCRIWIAGEDPQAVAHALRRFQNGDLDHFSGPPLPADAVDSRSFRVTIGDLGEFEADTYAPLLEDWCRATLEALGALPPHA
jgi:hypothetical protein